MTVPGSTPAQTQPGGQAKTTGDADPSMEDILASIRRILDDEVAADPQPAAPAATAEVVELTEQMLVAEEPATAPNEPREAPPGTPRRDAVGAATSPLSSFAAQAPAEGLISASAAGAAAASFAALRAASSSAVSPIPPKPETPIGHATLTLEEMIRQEIRPLLKTWLDENLPPLVERLVKAELERIARG